jgi:hypothetical protein
MNRIPIALKVPLFEIERFVTVSSCSPRHRCVYELTRLPIFSLEATLTRKIIPSYTCDMDVEINRSKGIGSQFIQFFLTIVCSIQTGAGHL